MKKMDVLAVVDRTEFLDEITRELHRVALSFDARRVESEEQLVHELMCHRPEVIVSNQGTASFSGSMAYAVAKEKSPEIPFIFVIAFDSSGIGGPSWAAVPPNTALRSPLSLLGCAIRQAVRQSQLQAKLREVALEALTSRWKVRSRPGH
jgi:hypothetical protein